MCTCPNPSDYRDFGSYALEIIEGRKTTEQDAQQTSQTNNVDNKLGDNKDTSTIFNIFVLLPVPFRGNIPQIPIKESGK
jgi:hypothetical protein